MPQASTFRDQRRKSDIFLCHSLPCFKAGSLTKLVVLARLAGQRPHGICLSVPRPPVLRLQACVVMKDFYVMLGIWTQIPFFT